MDTNSIVEAIQAGVTYIQPALSTIVGSLLTTLFLRNSTSKTEFEKIEAGRFTEAIELLLRDGKMTYYEYYKCRNFLNVAKLADKYRIRVSGQESNEQRTFDFDWFMRFFDSAGNISNHEMQKLWAHVLANEVQSPGSFSLRTIETLRNMTPGEAEAFKQATQLILRYPSGDIFLFITSEDKYPDVNMKFDFSDEKLMLAD